MKWSRNAIAAAALLTGACLFAELPQWIQDLDAGSGLESVFFRDARRPPRETRPELTKLIAGRPAEAALYSLRAHEAEEQLDFAVAETDWKKYAELAADKVAGQLVLADFYHRRLRPEDEIQTLSTLGRMPSSSSADRRSWQAFERIFTLIGAHALPAELAVAQYRAWMDRWPAEAGPYQRFLDFALSARRYADAGEAIARYQKQFPKEELFPLSARASLAELRGSADEALAIYDRALKPASSQDLVQRYFNLLKKSHNLRAFLDRARTAAATNPDDLNAASRIFYYYQQQGDLASAQRTLIEYRLRRESRNSAWTADQFLTLAALLEGAGNYDEAGRAFYGAWSLAGAPADAKEKGLAGLIHVLLSAPDQPIQFGRGDLSLYKDIATMDPYPGFLNGVLSLVLNTASPRSEYARQANNAVAYFHRAKASELMTLFDAQYPKSDSRDGLHALLIETYAIYGDSDGVIRRGQAYLSAFPSSPSRTTVALRIAEAHARKNQVAQEFADYDALLKELAAKAGGVPLGEIGEGVPPAPMAPGQQAQPPQWKPARSADYARVLDRYIARLVSMKRVNDALALYRRELDRNPNDPGLYERLAAFLDQNRQGAEIEQVYQRAIAQFQDRSWHQKLARWYLRQKQTAKFDQLTQQVVKLFDGTDLGKYFREVVGGAPIDPQLYLKVNQYAAQRFPRNLTFVKNLLDAYARKETFNPAASEQLLRRYWFYDDQLRARYFELLSRTGRLDAELAAIRNATSPAATEFVAEAEAWRSHFEASAPAFRAIAADFPANSMVVGRAAAVHRSLAAFDPKNTEIAAGFEQNLHRAAPRNSEILAAIGDVYADREQLDRARPFWNQMAEIEPGKPDGYLSAATVFWDYYLYDDALRLLAEGRTKLKQPALFAYQAGAIYENKREYARAVEEYVRGADQRSAQSRLIRLAKRPDTRDLVESATARPAPGAEMLRVAILESQNRRDDLSRYLLDLVAGTSSFELLNRVDEIADRQGFDEVRERSSLRQIALMRDPVEKLRLQLALARFYESKGDLAKAGQSVDAIANANPAILGVVRAAVDFHWRNKNSSRALDILDRSAAIANPALKKQFTFEAARKATEAAQYGRARKSLDSLLKDDPYEPGYLSAMADTWAREGNDRELRAFYTAKLGELRGASLSGDEKTARIAGLRRAYIPVLIRVKDFTGALDQYIELLNRYPEDEALAGEAAQYATSHGLKDRLLAAYARTSSESPKDYRWPMVQARLYTQFEDFNNAISFYSKAISIRPDRVDLYAGRASLEERLMRFDEAAATYAKLYTLTYRNPVWMTKVAESRARQRRSGDAVKALEQAYIEGRPPRAVNFFTVAGKLEEWDFLPEARAYAEKGIDLAGKSLGVDPEYADGMRVYARTLTRLGDYATAWNRLFAIEGTQPGLSAIAKSVQKKEEFAAFLEKQRNGKTAEVFVNVLLPVTLEAGLADLEARWRFQALMLEPGSPAAAMQESRLIELQSRRMRFDELGMQLEAYSNVYPNNEQKPGILARAAEAYRAGGNTEAEMRVLATGGSARYLELLARNRPEELIRLSAQKNWHEPVNAAILSGNAGVSQRAIETHGRTISPVWTRAYTGLAGLYFLMKSPEVSAAWTGALGSPVIGDRIGKRVDRNQQLAGNTWFYYGSRYGEYLAATNRQSAEDYLPAALENAPGNAEGYWQLGEYYRESGDAARAMAEYEYTLELDPLRGEAHDRVAELLWQQGKREEAAKRWKQCFDAFARLESERRLPPRFWNDVRGAMENAGKRSLYAQVKPDADRLLRSYVRRNGAYRVDPLLRGALAAAGDPKAGVAWIVEVSRSASDPATFLALVVRARWVPETSREPLYQALLTAAQSKAADARGEEKQWREADARNWQLQWIGWLLDTRQTERARSAVAALPAEYRKTMQSQVAVLDIRVAAQQKSLDSLIGRYTAGTLAVPDNNTVRNAAAELAKSGDKESAGRLLEFVYGRELDARNFDASNFLGLAEVRLQQGNLNEALSLLRRMQLVSGDAFDSLLPAARLLEKSGKRAEALEFANTRVQAVPWDRQARELQARLKSPPQKAAPASDYRALLRGVAASPDDLSLRLPLFRALHAAGRPQLAISAIAPLLDQWGLKWILQRATDVNRREEEPPDEPGEQSWMAQQFSSNLELSGAERATLAAQLAASYEAVNQYGAATLLLGIAQQLQPSAAMEKQLSAMSARVALRGENERRRPAVTENLEQPRTVRPRLTALAGGMQ